MSFDLAPYSGAISSVSDLVNSIIGRIWPDKTKVAEVQAEVMKQMLAGEYANELAAITAVNATMQAEAKSESWLQRSWRPMVGFTFIGAVLNNYVLVMYLSKFGVQPIAIPDTIWNAFLVILGAASATRGVVKAVEAWNKK